MAGSLPEKRGVVSTGQVLRRLPSGSYFSLANALTSRCPSGDAGQVPARPAAETLPCSPPRRPGRPAAWSGARRAAGCLRSCGQLRPSPVWGGGQPGFAQVRCPPPPPHGDTGRRGAWPFRACSPPLWPEQAVPAVPEPTFPARRGLEAEPAAVSAGGTRCIAHSVPLVIPFCFQKYLHRGPLYTYKLSALF